MILTSTYDTLIKSIEKYKKNQLDWLKQKEKLPNIDVFEVIEQVALDKSPEKLDQDTALALRQFSVIIGVYELTESKKCAKRIEAYIKDLNRHPHLDIQELLETFKQIKSYQSEWDKIHRVWQSLVEDPNQHSAFISRLKEQAPAAANLYAKLDGCKLHPKKLGNQLDRKDLNSLYIRHLFLRWFDAFHKTQFTHPTQETSIEIQLTTLKKLIKTSDNFKKIIFQYIPSFEKQIKTIEHQKSVINQVKDYMLNSSEPWTLNAKVGSSTIDFDDFFLSEQFFVSPIGKELRFWFNPTTLGFLQHLKRLAINENQTFPIYWQKLVNCWLYEISIHPDYQLKVHLEDMTRILQNIDYPSGALQGLYLMNQQSKQPEGLFSRDLKKWISKGLSSSNSCIQNLAKQLQKYVSDIKPVLMNVWPGFKLKEHLQNEICTLLHFINLEPKKYSLDLYEQRQLKIVKSSKNISLPIVQYILYTIQLAMDHVANVPISDLMTKICQHPSFNDAFSQNKIQKLHEQISKNTQELKEKKALPSVSLEEIYQGILEGNTVYVSLMLKTHRNTKKTEHLFKDLLKYVIELPASDQKHTYLINLLQFTILYLTEKDSLPLTTSLDFAWIKQEIEAIYHLDYPNHPDFNSLKGSLELLIRYDLQAHALKRSESGEFLGATQAAMTDIETTFASRYPWFEETVKAVNLVTYEHSTLFKHLKKYIAIIQKLYIYPHFDQELTKLNPKQHVTVRTLLTFHPLINQIIKENFKIETLINSKPLSLDQVKLEELKDYLKQIQLCLKHIKEFVKIESLYHHFYDLEASYIENQLSALIASGLKSICVGEYDKLVFSQTSYKVSECFNFTYSAHLFNTIHAFMVYQLLQAPDLKRAVEKYVKVAELAYEAGHFEITNIICIALYMGPKAILDRSSAKQTFDNLYAAINKDNGKKYRNHLTNAISQADFVLPIQSLFAKDFTFFTNHLEKDDSGKINLDALNDLARLKTEFKTYISNAQHVNMANTEELENYIYFSLLDYKGDVIDMNRQLETKATT